MNALYLKVLILIDPIAAMNEYALNWEQNLIVIGRSELPDFFTPTRKNLRQFILSGIFLCLNLSQQNV